MNPLLCPTYYNPSSSFFYFRGVERSENQLFFFYLTSKARNIIYTSTYIINTRHLILITAKQQRCNAFQYARKNGKMHSQNGISARSRPIDI